MKVKVLVDYSQYFIGNDTMIVIYKNIAYKLPKSVVIRDGDDIVTDLNLLNDQSKYKPNIN